MIFIGSDHAGFEYKSEIIKYFETNNIEYKDLGTHSKESCDYPIIAKEVAKQVAADKNNRGILVCGSGIGMCITANKVKGVHAAVCSETTSARLSRTHNNTNVLCLGERLIGKLVALEIVETWLNTDFVDLRHQKRIDMIEEL